LDTPEQAVLPLTLAVSVPPLFCAELRTWFDRPPLAPTLPVLPLVLDPLTPE
jgi:hypothetical protein